jgi:hypothetical protein
MRATTFFFAALILVSSLALSSCGPQGVEPPQPGTPAFAWNSAQDAFKKGDFLAASNKLDELTGKDSEFRDRAAVSQVVIALGIARGEMEWADILDDGAKYAREHALDFHRASFSTRGEANQMVMRAAEINHRSLDKLVKSDRAFPFTLPAMSTDVPIEAQKVKKGVTLKPAEQELAVLHMQQRGVLQTVAFFAGTNKDVDKARTLLAKGDFKISKDDFLLALAQEFSELSDLYGPKKLDQSGQVKMLCAEADKVLAELQPSPAVKAVQTKLAAIRKKLPKG